LRRLEGLEKLLLERVLTLLSVDRGYGIYGDDGGEIPDNMDPLLWVVWEVLESRRSLDKANGIRRILKWAVGRLPRREVEESIGRDLPLLASRIRVGSGVFMLARIVKEFILKPSIENLIAMAVSVRNEVYRPCSRDPRLESERNRVERVMARIGLVIGIVFSAFFIASIILAANVEVVLAMTLLMALMWYAVRRYGVRYAMLNAELAWSECSINTVGDLERLVSGYSPMYLLGDLLHGPGTRSRSQ